MENVAYRLALPEHLKIRSLSFLKPYHKKAGKEATTSVQKELELDLVRILSQKTKNKRVTYLVKWEKGLQESEATWEKVEAYGSSRIILGSNWIHYRRGHRIPTMGPVCR